MRTCVAVGEERVEDALTSCQKAVELGADLVEVRFDLMTELPSSLKEFEKIQIPKIATLRMKEQGGGYQGSDLDRLKFFRKAIASEFEFIDLEYDSKLFSEKELSHARMICSYHDFQGTPSTAQIIDLLVGCMAKGEIAKAAFKVNSIRNLSSLGDASRFISSTEKQFIIIGMGELGELTRLRADRLNSAWNYVSLESGRGTAPGQLDLETTKWLGASPTIAGVAGYPLGHTVSPSMHEAAFKALDIPGKYLAFSTTKDELEDLINIMVELDIKGMNITIPHKQAVMEYLDEISPEAKAIGAVNVVKNRQGHLIGMNTDISGIRRTFEEKEVSVQGRKALVIGAGGVARACCSYLRQGGATLFIINRTRSNAEAFARDFNASILDPNEAGKMDFDILINCTPLGMKGFPQVSPVPESMFHQGQVVMDVIYNPIKTPFLKEAESRGAKVLLGMDMLIYQAMDSFEAWTGRVPPYDVMARAAREAIE